MLGFSASGGLWPSLDIHYSPLSFFRKLTVHRCTERNNIFCNSGKGGFGIGSGGGREIFKEQRLWSSSFPCSTIWSIEMYKRPHTNHNLVDWNKLIITGDWRHNFFTASALKAQILEVKPFVAKSRCEWISESMNQLQNDNNGLICWFQMHANLQCDWYWTPE